MLSKADNSATFAVVAALVLFFIGGILTTVVPPLVDKSWARPFENNDPSQRPHRKAAALKRTTIARPRHLRA
jgi:cytochrome c oxidase cbb3-type subunit II